MKRLIFVTALVLTSVQLSAQDASSAIQALFEKYGSIPNYKVNVVYESVNDRMGFSNTQEGTLVVQGDKYILKFGDTETWLDDGTTEFVGTIEEDHSQIMRFCPGENTEAIVDFGNLFTFYARGHAGSISSGTLTLKPTADAPYTSLVIETNGNTINSITAIDDFGTSHKYTLSDFSTNASGTSFTINPARYYEKIDERSAKCK